jgi:hypothetical protein
MKKLALSFAILSAILQPALFAAPALAQNIHSWVSHNGNDGNSCLMSAPCVSFSHALANTVDGGEVSCLDSGGFAEPFTVTISVNINCSGAGGYVVAPNDVVSCGNYITINAPGKIVTLRGVDVTGVTGFEFFCHPCLLLVSMSALYHATLVRANR